jgi:diguanylate cyclase (GGDEF)-like protein/PAS domain S-box-containing protein
VTRTAGLVFSTGNAGLMENSVKLKASSYAKIFESLNDGLYFVDRDRIINYWNKAAEKISGFTAEEVVGRSCSDNILNHVDSEGNSLCRGNCPLSDSMKDKIPREVKVYLHHKDSHRVPVSARTSVLTDDDGKVIGGVELFTDISNQEANELRVKELEKLALLDDLTQLVNRNYINREVQSRFEENKRLKIPFGILFIDIDNFKIFNDKYGHDIGDAVLKLVAKTFVANGRPFDLFGRWGGEEFVGIIRNMNKKDLEVLGNRLRILVGKSHIIHDNENINVTLSVGATLVKDDDTIESLIKRADSLMYKSKQAGKNRLTLG